MKNFTNYSKHKTNPLWIRLLIMTFMLLVGTSSAWGVNITGGEVFYLTPHTAWNTDNARYAIYFFNNSTGKNTWTSMTKVEGESNLWTATAPSGTWANLIFCRMNPSASSNNWNSGVYWGGQTQDLTFDGTKNWYTVNSSNDAWNKPAGTWSTIYNITYNANGGSGAPSAQIKKNGTSLTLSSTVPTRTGYDFVNWNTKSDGSGTSYASGATYTENKAATLYAKWEQSCTPPGAPSLTNPDPLCGGSITLPESANEVNLKWYDAQTGGNVVSNTEITATGTYWAAAVAECESTDRTAYTVTINPIPEVNSLLSTLNICIGSIDETDLTTLSHVEVSSGSTAVWYTSEDGVEQAEGANLINGGTYWVAAENSTTGCKSTTRTSFTIYINDLPEAPSLGKDEYETCAHASNTVDLDELAGVNNVIWYQDKDEVQNPNTISIANEGTVTYTAKAVNSNGCQSATGVDFTLTVNPLPTITSISASNDEPVPFEDVVLTAEDTDAKTINWLITSGDGELSENTGTSVVLTSSTAGTVTVTATATSEADCTSAATKTVTFSAEDCAPVPSDDIKITFKTPSSNGANGQYWGLGTLYYKKDDGSSYTNVKLYEGTCKGGEQTSQEVTISNLQANATIYFKACYDFGGYTATTKKLTLTKGNKYIIGIISNENPSSTNSTNKTSEVGIEVTSKVSLTNDPPIKAPAVKMVSAEYDEENEVIVASGAVYKTGCGETFWGFQYSADGQTWGTTDADFIRPSSGNSLSEPGVFAHSFEIPNANGGDIYYIRAYAINNYNKDSYSLNSAVFSETKIPVEIPSSTIESATISLVDSEGKLSTNSKVCPQSTVYLRVDYTGGDYKEFEATENFPGTNLVEVTRNKLDNYAIFSFTATSAGTANITISNNNSSVTPATGVAITLNDVETITTPVISMDPASGMICSDGEATITIYEPNANYTYALYKDSELADDESKGSYTINEAGSYTVVATESVCGTSASSMAIELKVVSSDVKINLVADPTTTSPWQPIKLIVTPPAGYDYTLEGINDVEYTQNGDVYTVKIPRPETWPAGNSGTTLKTANKTFTANIKVSDTTSCGSKSVTVKLTDTEENCQ